MSLISESMTDKMNAEAIDDTSLLISSLKTLTIDDDTYDSYERKQLILSFIGWTKTPNEHHMKSSLTTSEIIEIFTNDCKLDVNHSSIPHLTRLPSKLVIQPYKKIEKPTAKPNLLVAIASVIYDIIKTTNNSDIDSILLKLTEATDIITQRNPIKKIFSYLYDRKEEWKVYACQPVPNGPVFIERTEIYSVNMGTIGNQFESAITSHGTYERVYAISKGILKNLNIVMTGEIDAYDDDSAIEIKTKPAWLHGSSDRDISNWIQSSLTGTEKFLTAGYYTDKNDKKGPVSFLKNNIIMQSLDEYCQHHKSVFSDNKRNKIYRYGSDILHKIKNACTKVGTVYEISCDKNDINNIFIKEMDDAFPINENIIRNTCEAIATIIHTSINRNIEHENTNIDNSNDVDNKNENNNDIKHNNEQKNNRRRNNNRNKKNRIEKKTLNTVFTKSTG